jgi:hypothetical protein
LSQSCRSAVTLEQPAKGDFFASYHFNLVSNND